MTVPARGARLLPVAIALFAVGVLATVAIFVMFAAGAGPLPWLWGAAMLLPVGLVLAVVAVVQRERR